MCGSALWMLSLSISSTRRSTPCAAGCCGPKFMVRLRSSATRTSRRGAFERLLVTVVVADHARHQGARLYGDWLVHHPLALGVVAHLDIADQREVLAEGVADEAVVGQQAAQVRLVAEQDPEQVEDFALEPVGAGPDAGHRVDRRILLALAPRAQAQSPLVGEGTKC